MKQAGKGKYRMIDQKEEKEKTTFLTPIKPFENSPHLAGRIPKWEATIGVLLTGIIYFFLPDELTFGPPWVLLAIEVVLLLPLWIFWLTGHALPFRVTRRSSLVLLGVVTLALAVGVLFLIQHLAAFKSGLRLLQTAALLWTFNVLVFALWYWDTDGGGPRNRHQPDFQPKDLLFPQQANHDKWTPEFFDYLFVAFTGATAFSPTDTYPLTRQAKLLMMAEGIISLMLVAIVVSRVANIF